MKHGSLFSGIGGFDLAAEWMGWENVFHCEWNPFGQKVLHHYWPQAIQYHDITQTDFTIHRGRIDILTGGFPCQPYSMAGKRLGKEDERHLWPEMLRAIREIAPRYVVGENVLGLTNWNGGMVFDEVHSDLEAAGYEVQAVVIPAAAVNAPHGRDRVWFVGRRIATDTDSGRLERTTSLGRNGEYVEREGEFGLAADTDSNGQHRRNSEHEVFASEGRLDALGDIGTGGEHGLAADTEGGENNGNGQSGFLTESAGLDEHGLTSDTASSGWRQVRRLGKSGFADQNGEIGNWQNFPTQSPICGGDDGLSRELDGITFSKWRNESIKAYGNAVVPQVVYQIFKAIAAIDRQEVNL
jgi:DNA (cytosine-5)-methyltransferase 1